jgi:D-alanyl-D-alanine carboxypeptidase
MTSTDPFADLRIPSDYGRNPRRPRFKEAATLEDVEPNLVGAMQRLAPETAAAWRDLKRSAADAGVQLLLVSGFRSIRHQADLIRRKLAAGQSIDKILTVNAAPGFSEHHTGRAVDIASPPYGRGNRFGFEYEPWHWSQVETEARRRKSDARAG